jgi:anti-anti-sigma factor
LSQVTVQEERDHLVVRLAGHLSEEAYADLLHLALQLARPALRAVVLDCAAVTDMEAIAFAGLTELCELLLMREVPVALVRVPAGMEEQLRRSGFLTALPAFRDEAEARSYLDRRRWW